MCQYDSDTLAEGHPHPHADILQKKKKKWKLKKKGHNAHTCNNWQILPQIDFDLYFMIIYLCMKYESKTLTFFKMSL